MHANTQQIDEEARPTSQFERRMYTVTEAAQLLGLGRSTAYELVATGGLPAIRMGRRWLISPAVLRDLLGEQPPPPVKPKNQHRRARAARQP